MMTLFARRNFALVRSTAVRQRFFSNETDRLEATKKALGATNDALRKLLVKGSPAAAAITDTRSVMKSTTETLAAIRATVASDTAASTLLKTRNALSDSNETLRQISSRLNQRGVVPLKEAELRQVREENGGLRKVLAQLDPSEVVKSVRAGKATAQPPASSPAPSPPTTTTVPTAPVFTAPSVRLTVLNNSNRNVPPPPPPPRNPVTDDDTDWFDAESEPLWFKYRVQLAATGGFLVGLIVGKMAFSGSQKPSKAEKARVAQLQREIDAEKVEQERLLKEIARKTKEELNK